MLIIQEAELNIAQVHTFIAHSYAVNILIINIKIGSTAMVLVLAGYGARAHVYIQCM